MTSTTKNIFIVLAILTIAFAGYYLYTTQDATVLNTDSNQIVLQNMLDNTQVFIERRQELNNTNIAGSLGIFEDERFRSLRSFTSSVEEQSVGKDNPFSQRQNSPPVTSTSE